MFEFLKKTKNQEENSSDLLSIEQSAFNMQSDNNTSFSDVPDYQSLVYKEPVYDVPAYKAINVNEIDVVIDSNALGFDKNAISPNIKTIELPSNDEEKNSSIINNNVTDGESIELIDILDHTEPSDLNKPTLSETIIEPIPSVVYKIREDTSENNQRSIFQNLPDEDIRYNTSVETKNTEDIPEMSIFGSKDGIEQVNSYSSQQQYEEEKKELITEVDYTEDGYKICPNCGTILVPTAPICFMCSKSFVLKK